jgi:hypothetical protein
MSTARSFSFPFSAAQSTAAEGRTIVDPRRERQLYCEVASAMKGNAFDEAVVEVYSSRPERDLPSPRNSRRAQRKYSLPGQ